MAAKEQLLREAPGWSEHDAEVALRAVQREHAWAAANVREAIRAESWQPAAWSSGSNSSSRAGGQFASSHEMPQSPLSQTSSSSCRQRVCVGFRVRCRSARRTGFRDRASSASTTCEPIPKAQLIEPITTLGPEKLAALCSALRDATDCREGRCTRGAQGGRPWLREGVPRAETKGARVTNPPQTGPDTEENVHQHTQTEV